MKIVPPVPHDMLHNYYKSCDVLLFLCQVGVGYGQVNIEATHYAIYPFFLLTLGWMANGF